jgi:molybdate transport system regulatory protein
MDVPQCRCKLPLFLSHARALAVRGHTAGTGRRLGLSNIAMRYPGLTLRILGSGNPAMGPGKAALIAHIEATGSISAAAREMGMSYRRAWQLVEAINQSFNEPVIVTATGGKRGGGAMVTDYGRGLVEQFRAMENKASAAIAEDLAQFATQLRARVARRKG